MNQHVHNRSQSPMKKSSTLLFACIVLVSIAGIAISIFRVPPSSILLYGAILACPLMHIFMMRGMSHGEKR